MAALGVFFGLLAVGVLCLIVTLVRRGSGRTENVEGLLIEQQRRLQAHSDRNTYHSTVVHNTPHGLDGRRRQP
ncbi:hypothetical protein [Streptomyces purpureus]|uniref:Uncharacterized protein n=1 Tax=Streptomyces purpureus TaxID=1951 RepID=A0A918HAG5_9ACTN|nr:hypothetical protein [Streptomyces purpureus]GGT48247.1 hypothetical protein GCM10014713_48200 [Streptomyces purpureus]